ncbi:meiotic recombination protein REC8 homolog [Discoglossus pictus]
MFYYPNVLQRHTGCFSTIWLAATRGSKIVKREYMKVNVIHTCQQIMKYILHQIPAPYPGVPAPRLSLYLSAQLSYGVVCVYHRQCDFLIEEMKNTLERLHRAKKMIKIDLLQPEQQLLLPDALSLMQMLEAAPDPFFGMMGIPPELPDPLMIPQIRMLVEAPSPERVRVEKTPPRRRKRKEREDIEHLTSPESITLREVEPLTLPPIEMVRDLPEVSAHDLEFLMSDLPTFPEEENLPDPRITERAPGVEEEEPSGLTDGKLPKEKKKRPPKEKEVDLPPVSSPTQVSLKEDVRDRELEEAEKKRLQAAESEKERLREKEKEKERLQKAERERQLQQVAESKRKNQDILEREKRHQKDTEKERKLLKKVLKEIKHLREMGAEEVQIEEMLRKADQLKKLQKERERQWEADKIKDHLRDSEIERERLKEAERAKERLKEIESEIEQLKKSVKKIEKERKQDTDREHLIVDDWTLLLGTVEAPFNLVSVDDPRRSKPESPIARLSPALDLPLEVGVEQDADIFLEDIIREPVTEGTPEKLSPPCIPPLLPSPPLGSPQLVLPEVPQEKRRRTRVTRHRGLIIDKETQIGSKEMQEQIRMHNIHTQEVVPVAMPHRRCRTLADLLHATTYPHVMSRELSLLWSSCTLLEELQYVQEREEETMSEMEVVRAATEPSISHMFSSEISLEVSEEERSRPVLFTPEERRVLSMPDDRFLPVVHEMPEHMVELPETEDILMDDVERRILSHVTSVEHTQFSRLAPSSLSRLLASKLFYNCLVLCSQQIIQMEQTEPYGQILITSGRRYT